MLAGDGPEIWRFDALTSVISHELSNRSILMEIATKARHQTTMMRWGCEGQHVVALFLVAYETMLEAFLS